jgi:hypothetical protein
MRKLPEPKIPQAARPDAQVAATPALAEGRQAPFVVEALVGSGSIDARHTLNAPPEVRGLVEMSSPVSPTAIPTSDASNALCDASREPNRAAFALALDAPRQRASCKPLRPGRYKLELTAGQGLHDKLTQLQDLLRHQVPDGDLAVIVERAVDLLVDDTMKRRFAQRRAPEKPRSKEQLRPAKRTRSVKRTRSAKRTRSGKGSARSADSRYIPRAVLRAVLRAVYQRDAGQCTFVSADGKRCSERGFLEFHHHDQPFARGGEATVENLRLVCRAHNTLFAERDFGRTYMQSKRMSARASIDELVSKRVQV